MQRSATVTRLSNGQLNFRWPVEQFQAPVSISWGSSPNSSGDGYRPLAVVKEGNEVAAADPSPGRRPYFRIVPMEGRPMLTAERRLPLAGQVNFRDLGGYATSDGRRVRWGQLYRSGDLGHLTDDDLVYLDGLGLKLVCDLRVDFELERAPDRLPDGAAWLSLPIRGGEIPENRLYNAVDNGDFSDLDNDFLVRGNRMFVRDFSPAYGEMVRRLAGEDNRPAVFHCTAGKDRAGLGAALVLLVLGVPLETVYRDYLLTNTYRAEWSKQMLARIRQHVVDWRGVPAESVDMSPVEALFVARRAYLGAALETIDQEYGSFDAYVRDGLGMSPQAQEAFREFLLT